MDRFERNFRAMTNTLEDLANIGVRVFSIHENLELANTLTVNLFGIINEHYIQNLSWETAKGKHQAAKEGYFIGSRVPFGYRKWKLGDSPEIDKRMLIVDEKEAAALTSSPVDNPKPAPSGTGFAYFRSGAGASPQPPLRARVIRPRVWVPSPMCRRQISTKNTGFVSGVFSISSVCKVRILLYPLLTSTYTYSGTDNASLSFLIDSTGTRSNTTPFSVSSSRTFKKSCVKVMLLSIIY